mmetsp:Transcript_157959/g.294669  ORF Transcript_157959/g.294669 Transcript_157959/m.294669 type:complete len:101 (-) Transcript_157959:71-373(-)
MRTVREPAMAAADLQLGGCHNASIGSSTAGKRERRSLPRAKRPVLTPELDRIPRQLLWEQRLHRWMRLLMMSERQAPWWLRSDDRHFAQLNELAPARDTY